MQCLFPRQTNAFFDKKLNNDDFQEIQKLGKGSFGQVKRCIHKKTTKQYAIKKIPLKKTGKMEINSKQIESMTRKQLEVLYKVDNEHIVKLIDHFEEKDVVYLITEYIQGANLYDQTKKAFSMETAASVIYQICDSLQQLHSNCIIHRDLKLQNIMFNDGKVKIVDLGCSNYYGDDIHRKTMIGTKPYWSPELISHEKQDDRLDIWCVGVILYEILFLQEPFKGSDMEMKIKKCEYYYPQAYKGQRELEDLFKKVFTHKNSRIRATQLKNHPWVKKYNPHRKQFRKIFEQNFTADQVEEYRQLLCKTIEEAQIFTSNIRNGTAVLQNLLAQVKRDLRKK